MSNWKKRVDAYQERESSERFLQYQQLELKRLADEKEARNRNLTELQKSCFCHICHRPTSGPLDTTEEISEMGCPRVVGGLDWNSPNDLYKCDECHDWTCTECLHHNICKDCWSKKIAGTFDELNTSDTPSKISAKPFVIVIAGLTVFMLGCACLFFVIAALRILPVLFG